MADDKSRMRKYFRFGDLDGVSDRWRAIDDYNESIRNRVPPGASDFVFSGWHYDYGDPRCPHDSWLKSLTLKPSDDNKRVQDVRLHLLGAFHDRELFLDYSNVTDFSIEGQLVGDVRRMDWLFDEVHLLDSGLVEHIIEFEKCFIRIECTDLNYKFELL